MKKLFSIFLFAVFALVSGVILTSCCGNDNKVITITDTSGLADVKLKIGEEYIIGDSSYTIANNSNVTVEFNASKLGVDFDDIEIFVNGNQLNIDTDVFGKENEFGEDRYNPSLENNLYFGYIKLARIENDVNITIDGLKMISTAFKFELDNSEDIENEEVIEKLKLTKISFANDADSDDDYNTNLYDFMKSDNSVIEKEYDANLNLELNSFRVLRFRFDGIQPFNIDKYFPFKIFEDGVEDELTLATFYIGKTFFIDCGELNIKEKKDYRVVIDYANLDYYEYEIELPLKNETFDIKYTVKDAEKQTVNITDTVEFEIEEKMPKSEVGIYADYTNVNLEINGTILEANQNGKFKFKNLTPKITSYQDEIFKVSVRNIRYYQMEGEIEQEVIPISLKIESDLPYYSEPLFTPQINKLDEEQKTDVSGVDATGVALGFEGDKTVISWEYTLSEDIGAYKSMINLQKYDLYLNDILLFKLGDMLNNMNLVEDDLYSQELNGFILKARKNQETNIFDKFELVFDCAPQLQKVVPPESGQEEPTEYYIYEMNFKFTNGEIVRKDVDVSFDFKDENVVKAETRVYRDDALIQDNWKELTKQKPSLTLNDVECFNIIEIKLTMSTLGYTEYKLQDSRLEKGKLDDEIYIENDNFVVILKYYVADDYYISSDIRLKYDVVSE